MVPQAGLLAHSVDVKSSWTVMQRYPKLTCSRKRAFVALPDKQDAQIKSYDRGGRADPWIWDADTRAGKLWKAVNTKPVIARECFT